MPVDDKTIVKVRMSARNPVKPSATKGTFAPEFPGTGGLSGLGLSVIRPFPCAETYLAEHFNEWINQGNDSAKEIVTGNPHTAFERYGDRVPAPAVKVGTSIEF